MNLPSLIELRWGYRVRRWVLLVPHEFTVDDGALTPTLKLRRKIVEERYKKQISDLYEEREVSTSGKEKAFRRRA